MSKQKKYFAEFSNFYSRRKVTTCIKNIFANAGIIS